jgi:basic membrane protein A
MITCVTDGQQIAAAWTGTIATASVQLTDHHEDVAAAGTAAKLEEVKAGIEAGTIRVFDASAITVGGKAFTSYMADVDTDKDYTKDTEAISDGYFHESEFRSAPYFDARIDGITLLNEQF